MFASTRDGSSNQELYSVAPDGTGLARLTWSETVEQHPSWSPDGSQIAFASTRPFNGNWHIWVVNTDGSGMHQVTNEFSTSPAWSPDGSRIAFLGSGGGISVINADGSDAHQVTFPSAGYSDERPSWSPDASRLAFPRRLTFGNDPQLYVVDADGSNERQLTTTEGASRFPSWSPDGEQIVFTHINRLSVINADGSGMRPLIGEPWGEDLTPDWGTSTTVPDPQVPGAPTIQIFSPEAQLYPAGYPLGAFYLCESETSYVVSCEGDVPVGSLVDTTTNGRHTFTVQATDAEGRTSTATVSYDVLDFLSPTVIARAPADGAEYEVGQSIEVDYECLDEPGGSGIELCDGELQDGEPLDTSRAGSFTVHFWTVDRANNVGQRSVTYRVADRTPPTIAVTSPHDGAVYVLGESVVASYTCDGAISCRGDVQSGALLDTSTVGMRSFTVTARDASMNVATELRSYRIVYPFSGFASPLAAFPTFATLEAGDKVPAKFSLGANRGLGIVAGSTWMRVSCGNGTPLGDSSPTAATGRLSYHGGRYQLQVETDASWAGSCRQLAVTLDDGTTHRANISFD